MGKNQTVVSLSRTFTGNVAASPLLNSYRSKSWGGRGIEAGGRIFVDGLVTFNISITDSLGVVLYTGTGISASADIDPVPRGITGPVLVTITSFSGDADIIVNWWVKK